MFAPKTPYDDVTYELAANANAGTGTLTFKANPLIGDGAVAIYATLISRDTYGNSPFSIPERKEKVLITNISGTTATLSANLAQNWLADDVLEIRIRAQHLIDMFNALTDGTQGLSVGDLFVTEVLQLGVGTRFAASDATPSVGDGMIFFLASSGTQTITQFDDGHTGQFLFLICDTAGTTVQANSNIVMPADWVPSPKDCMIFTTDDGTHWYPFVLLRKWNVTLGAHNATLSTTPAAGPTVREIATSSVLGFHCSTLDFDQSTDEYAHWKVMLPPDYDGRPLRARLVWAPVAGTTGNVLCRLYAKCYGDIATPVAKSTITTLSDAFSATGRIMQSAFVTFTPETPTDGKLLDVTLRRNASGGSDTFDADAPLIALEIAYL